MPTANKFETFASLCLKDMKHIIASEIRSHINANTLLYKTASEIFDVSIPTICKIANFKEDEMSFEILHHAAVMSGMTVSMKLAVPN